MSMPRGDAGRGGRADDAGRGGRADDAGHGGRASGDVTIGDDIASADVADLVARLRRAMRRAARVALPTMPLSVAQLELLSVVAEHPGSRSGDLADMLRLAPNSVSTLANAMLAAGMLARVPGERDRRTVEYTLTEQGSGMVADWQETNAAVLAAAVGGIAPERRHLLAAALPVLAELVERVDAQADEAGAADPVRAAPSGG